MRAGDDQIAGALIDAAVDGAGWQGALLDLAGACNAQVGSMVLVDKATGRGAGFCLGVDERWSDAFVAREARHVALGSQLVKPGSVFTDRMVADRRMFERSNFFETWAQPSGQTEYAGVAVLNDAKKFVFVGLSRGPRRGAFSADELATLDRLAPQIRRAARIWVALGAAEEARRAMEAALDHVAHAVFLTNAAGSIGFLNVAAAALLGEHGTLAVRRGSLVCVSEKDDRRLSALIASAGGGLGPFGAGRMKLAPARGAQPLNILVAPLSPASDRPAPRAEVMVIAVAPCASMRGAAERLRSYFGLTRVESLLATHIVEGSGLKAAALALNIAPTTARTHLNRIFEKTGARNQAALAGLLGVAVALTPITERKSSN